MQERVHEKKKEEKKASATLTTPKINDFQLQIFCDNVDHVLFTGSKPHKKLFSIWIWEG